MTMSQGQPQRSDPQFELCDLWTDPDKSVNEILHGTAALIPALLSVAKGGSEEVSSYQLKVRITLSYEHHDNKSNKVQAPVSCKQFWSHQGKEDSVSDVFSRFRSGLLLSSSKKPAWISVEIPASSCRGKNQNAGGEKTAEMVRPIGKIDVFQVQQLALNLDRGLSYGQTKLENDRKAQHEQTLQRLAQRLGRVVSNRWVVEEQQKDLKILQDKERRLVESQDLAKIGQWEYDLTNDALYWSSGVYDMFRIDPNQFGASYEAFMDAIHPDDRKFVDAAYKNSLKTKKPYNILHRLLFPSEGKDKEPEIRWVNEICRTEYHPETGQPLYSVGIVQDITELKEAQEMDRLKTAFLANMSHEIRTPLNAIMGYTDLLLMEAESLSEQNRGYLKTIRQSGELLMNVVSDILDISKIEAGQLQIDDKPYFPSELVALVGQCARAYQENFMAGKSVKLEFNNDHSFSTDLSDASQQTLIDHNQSGDCICSSVQVMGDPQRIQQVLNNLVNNALKFTGIKGTTNGRVEYGIKLVEGNGPSEKMMEFYVSDNGVGIPEEKQHAIFEAFHQVHPSRDSHELGGTGLGLTISKRLVEMMGGELTLWSSTHTIHHGTTVSFTIPYRPVNEGTTCQRQDNTNKRTSEQLCSCLQQLPSLTNMGSEPKPVASTSLTNTTFMTAGSEPKPAASTSFTSNDTAKETASTSSPSAGKVLVVDDNRVNLKLAVRLVNKLGFETITAMNGQEAVTRFKSDPSVELILMDKEMPVMDGLEAVKHIRQMEMDGASNSNEDAAMRIPIVALTAAAYKEDEEACLAAGCDMYLTKPVKREALRAVLASYLKVG